MRRPAPIKLLLPLLVMILLCSRPFAQETEDIKSRPASSPAEGTLTYDTDLHYTGRFCAECHEKTPVKDRDKFLKAGGDYTKLCWCHGYTPGTYIHPVEIEPSEDKKAKIPADLPLRDGKVTCSTCHDIYLQCREDPTSKMLNRRFLRGAPYVRRTDLCFRCHDEKKYKMLDPHNQFDENENIVIEKCLYCHTEKPNEGIAAFEDVKLIGNIEMLCIRCHGSPNHPANADHLVAPSSRYLLTMKETEKQFDIALPLNYDGKITCITCHNPHERGVIPFERLGAKGASEEYRGRLPGKMCIACHLQ